MTDEDELASLPSEELVRVGLTGRNFKKIGSVLARRVPSEPAVGPLVDAFRKRSADYWLIAYLLGCLGHESGYGCVCDILCDPDLDYAGGYAGSALIRIAGERAARDLIRIVCEAPTYLGREDAASGLSTLQSENGRGAVIDAAQKGRLRPKAAAPSLIRLGLEPATVEAWFVSQDPDKICIALEVVSYGARQPKAGPRACTWSYAERRHLLRLADNAITSAQIQPKPYHRRDLRYGARRASMIWRILNAAKKLSRPRRNGLRFYPGPPLLR